MDTAERLVWADERVARGDPLGELVQLASIAADGEQRARLEDLTREAERRFGRLGRIELPGVGAEGWRCLQRHRGLQLRRLRGRRPDDRNL